MKAYLQVIALFALMVAVACQFWEIEKLKVQVEETRHIVAISDLPFLADGYKQLSYVAIMALLKADLVYEATQKLNEATLLILDLLEQGKTE